MIRELLPQRRRLITIELFWCWNDIHSNWQISIGLFPDGRPAEVFISSPKIGSELESLLQDACVLVSHLLQRGVSLAALARSLSREGISPSAPAGSILGLILEKMGEAIE